MNEWKHRKRKKVEEKTHSFIRYSMRVLFHRNVNRYVACNDISVAFLTFTSKVAEEKSRKGMPRLFMMCTCK